MRKIKVGDWVRFYRNCELVVGVVQYVHNPMEGFTSYRIVTDHGIVDSSEILEVRGLSNK